MHKSETQVAWKKQKRKHSVSMLRLMRLIHRHHRAYLTETCVSTRLQKMDLTNAERCGMVLENINRIEVIDHTRDFTKGESARAFSKFMDDMLIEIVTQDDGKTVKIFISPKLVLDKLNEV